MDAAKFLLVASICLVLLVGCSSPEPVVPSAGNVFSVPLRDQHFGTITAQVVDEVGLVTNAHRLDDVGALLGSADAGAIAAPDTSSLRVIWLGGACRFGPTVTLTGSAADLLVTIQPDAGEGLPPGIVCNSIGLLFGVELTLASPVQQGAVSLQVR